jgi:hypothetical protein
MTTLHQLSKKYRKLCETPQKWDAQLQEARDHIKNIQESKRACLQNIENTKILIDFCVITGESPVQAQLSHTLPQMKETVHRHVQGIYSDHIQLDIDYNSALTKTITPSPVFTGTITCSSAITGVPTYGSTTACTSNMNNMLNTTHTIV